METSFVACLMRAFLCLLKIPQVVREEVPARSRACQVF
jgi:hypothetical protein